MKILTVCDEGNNRSVVFAHLLKYKGHDTISVGLKRTSDDTLLMLFEWADKIITTASDQEIPSRYIPKTILFDVGEDKYHRPFNQVLYLKAKEIIEKNKDWL